MKGKLTPKQRMFVSEYLVDLNSTQAAIRAGYSAKTADRIGPELLGKTWVAKAIQQKLEKRQANLEITADRIDRETARIAFFDIRKLYRPDGSLIPVTELDEDTARALAGIEHNEWGPKYKTASKEKALELLYRRLGLLKDNPLASVNINNQVLVIHTSDKHEEAG